MDILLESWGVPQDIIDIFKANLIEVVDQLQDLPNNPEIIKELVPVIGMRLKILSHIKSLIAENKAISRMSTDTETETESNSSYTTYENISENISSRQINEDTPIDIIGIEPTVDTVFDLSLLREKMPDFDLKTLLCTSPLGKSVLNYYDTNRYLDETRKNRLAKIIIRYLFNHIVKNKMIDQDYEILCSKIVGLFPNEKAGVYFTRAVPMGKSPARVSEPKRGKLYHQVRNILFLSGETKSGKRHADSVEEQSNRKKYGDIDDLKKSHSEDILWLKLNREPWNTVIEKWNQTFELRQNIQRENMLCTVDEFLKEWPILLDLRADVLKMQQLL